MIWSELVDRYKIFRKSRAIFLDLKKEYKKSIKEEQRKIRRHPLEKPFVVAVEATGLLGLVLYIFGYLIGRPIFVIIGFVLLISCIILAQIDIMVFTRGILKGVWIGDDKNGESKDLLNGQDINVYDYMEIMRQQIRRKTLKDVAQKYGLDDEYEVLFVIEHTPPIHPLLRVMEVFIVVIGTVAMIRFIPCYKLEYGLRVLVIMVIMNLVFSKSVDDIIKFLENGYSYKGFLDYGINKVKKKWI